MSPNPVLIEPPHRNKSYPLVQHSLTNKAQQLVVNQVQVLLPSVDDGHNDIMPDCLFRVM